MYHLVISAIRSTPTPCLPAQKPLRGVWVDSLSPLCGIWAKLKTEHD